MTAHRTALIASTAAALLLGAASQACAQASASQTTTATGTIFQPISLAKDHDLSFGNVVRPASGSGTVSVPFDGSIRTLSGSGALIAGGPNLAFARAAYTVTGEGGQLFSIAVPANFNMTRVGGVETISVTLTPSVTGGTLSGALGSTGTLPFYVGGAMPMTSTTVSGAYSGTFSVTVTYN